MTPPAGAGEVTPRGTDLGARAWISKAAGALADQGLFAVSNFILNVLLARWLLPDDYGAFTVAFSVFLLVAVGHGALMAEPMMVFGAGRYADRFRPYLRTVLEGTVGLSLLVAAAMVATGLFGAPVGLPPEVGRAMVGLALAIPFILSQWLLRRACYVEGPVTNAAWAGAVYLALVVPGALMLERIGMLDGARAYGLMGVASLVSAVWLVWRLGLPRERSRVEWRTVAVSHWGYGRWALASGVLHWVPVNLLLLVVPLYTGLSGAGSLRAAMYLVMPFWQATTALSNVLLPSLVRARGTSAFRRRTLVALMLFTGGGAAYGLALVVGGQSAAGLLYAGHYTFDLGLLVPIGLATAVSGCSLVLTAALLAVERPDLVFWGHVGAVAVTLTAGLFLTATMGVTGVATSLLLAWLAQAAVLGAVVARRRSRSVRVQ